MQIVATVNGSQVPLERLRVGGGSYGSAGHANMFTSQSALTAAKIDLYKIMAAATAPVEVTVTITDDAGVTTRVFGGEFVSHASNLDDDGVTIAARDWAGQLIDQKRVLTRIVSAAEATVAPLAPGQNPAAISVLTQNQQISAIVSAIAQQFGFAPVLNLTAGNPVFGTLYGAGDTVFTSAPQSLWSMLCLMARDLGYEVHVTPNRQLVFGTPGAGLPTQAFSYGVPAVPPPSGSAAAGSAAAPTLPCRNLVLHHAARRNRTFRVLVLGYDPARAQTVTGRATAIGSDFAGEAGLKPGIWLGPDAATADAAIAGVGLTAAQAGLSSPRSEVPRYTFHIDGLTAAQAQIRAQGIAYDIAKRDIAATLQVDGLPTIGPMQTVTLSGAVPPEAAGRNFYVHAYEHEFRMPQGGLSPDAGFLTNLRLLTLPFFGANGPTAPE